MAQLSQDRRRPAERGPDRGCPPIPEAVCTSSSNYDPAQPPTGAKRRASSQSSRSWANVLAGLSLDCGQSHMTQHVAGQRTTRMTRAAIGVGASIPALLLALLSVASLAYFFGFLRPLAGEVDSVLPIDPGDASPGFALLSAVGMGALSVGLLKGKAGAWWLTVATLAVALLYQAVALAHPLGVVAVGGPLAVLLADNRRYEVETSASWRRRILALLVVAGVIIGLETSLVIAATGAWPRPLAALSDATSALGDVFGISDDAAGSILSATSHNALLALLILVARLPIVLAAIGVLSPVPEHPADPSTRARARAIGQRFGRGALLPFQLGDDKFVFSPADEDGVVVYGVAGGTAVVLGDPIGPEEDAPKVLAAFLARCHKVGRMPVFYQASGPGGRALAEAGFRLFRVGQEAVIELGDFDLTGPRRANLRHTITRCRKAGVSVRWFPSGIDPKVEPGLVGELEAIDESWRKGTGPELGFTISQFDVRNLRWQPNAVAVAQDGRALGFTTLWPTGSDGGWVLDLMRRTADSPPGVVEFCIAEAASALRASGSTTLSLGLAPLARLDPAGPAEERLLALGARLVRRWYDVRGLAFFKSKFDPVWVPRYGAIRRRRNILGFAIALLFVHVKLASMLPRWRRSTAEPSATRSAP
jgi:phosphatidylglycerol lysyltransferase